MAEPRSAHRDRGRAPSAVALSDRHAGDRAQLAAPARRAGRRPTVIGLNYYVTSDRFLDDRLDRYPRRMHGGNGRQRYADVERCGSTGVGLRGHAAVLAEAWQRYRRPVAITEAHLGLHARGADALAGRGLAAARMPPPRRARTSAPSRPGRCSDRGTGTRWSRAATPATTSRAPSTSGPGPRQPTALAGMITRTRGRPRAAAPRPRWPGLVAADQAPFRPSARPMLITGASGTLGRAFVQPARRAGCATSRWRAPSWTSAIPRRCARPWRRWRPWAIVNAAGYVRVDEAERERVACRRANAVGPAVLAAVCRKAGIQLVTFSSDLVFDGQRQRPYVESDPVGPLNIYGRSKVEAERRVLALPRRRWSSAPARSSVRGTAPTVIACALDALASGADVPGDVATRSCRRPMCPISSTARSTC